MAEKKDKSAIELADDLQKMLDDFKKQWDGMLTWKAVKMVADGERLISEVKNLQKK